MAEQSIPCTLYKYDFIDLMQAYYPDTFTHSQLSAMWELQVRYTKDGHIDSNDVLGILLRSKENTVFLSGEEFKAFWEEHEMQYKNVTLTVHGRYLTTIEDGAVQLLI